MTDTAAIEVLRAAWETARDEARRNPTIENREHAKLAWAAYDAAAPRRKGSNYASRAGKRQAAERRAPKINPEGLYLGRTARTTGRDISGQPIEDVDDSAAAEFLAETGEAICCEVCGLTHESKGGK